MEENFLKEVHAICNENNIMTIADEVQCGFGRTGTYWNIEQKNIVPDILTFGKGIGGGFPIAGLVSSQKILDNTGNNFLGGTYGGNAISCAAAITSIDIMKDEKLLDNVNYLGHYLKIKLEKMSQIKTVRQYGLMIAIELNDLNAIDIVRKLNHKNVLVLTCGDKGQYIRLLPPLNIKKKECDIFLEILRSLFV